MTEKNNFYAAFLCLSVVIRNKSLVKIIMETRVFLDQKCHLQSPGTKMFVEKFFLRNPCGLLNCLVEDIMKLLLRIIKFVFNWEKSLIYVDRLLNQAKN